jgi:hypothetical protein
MARPQLGQHLCDGSNARLVDLLEILAYGGVNRTRPASIRKDMHTGRVFCFWRSAGMKPTV